MNNDTSSIDTAPVTHDRVPGKVIMRIKHNDAPAIIKYRGAHNDDGDTYTVVGPWKSETYWAPRNAKPSELIERAKLALRHSRSRFDREAWLITGVLAAALTASAIFAGLH